MYIYIYIHIYIYIYIHIYIYIYIYICIYGRIIVSPRHGPVLNQVFKAPALCKYVAWGNSLCSVDQAIQAAQAFWDTIKATARSWFQRNLGEFGTRE